MNLVVEKLYKLATLEMNEAVVMNKHERMNEMNE
jgi:hypothetical protein